MAVVSPENVEALMRRKLDNGAESGPERTLVVDMLIPAMQDVIEGYLGRAFGERDVTERLEVVGYYLYPGVLPLISVTSVALPNGTELLFAADRAERIYVGSLNGESLTVTYRAGEPTVPPTVRMFAASAIARSVLAPVQVAVGLLASYTVEGTSITYSPSMTDGSQESPVGYTVGELTALSRYRRLQIA
jgi:hypothetical protein